MWCQQKQYPWTPGHQDYHDFTGSTLDYPFDRYVAVHCTQLDNFYRASSYDSAVLAVVILSVCLSYSHFVTKANKALQIF